MTVALTPLHDIGRRSKAAAHDTPLLVREIMRMSAWKFQRAAAALFLVATASTPSWAQPEISFSMANNTTVEESDIQLTVTICSDDGISSVSATHYTSRSSNAVLLLDGPYANCDAGYDRVAYLVELTLSKGTNTLRVEATNNFSQDATEDLVINYMPPNTDPPEQQDYPVRVTAPGAGGVRVVHHTTRALPFVFTNIGTLSSNFLVSVSCTNVIFMDCKKVGGTNQFFTGTLAPLASATFDIEVFANKPWGTGGVRVIAASTINGAIKDTGLVELTIDRATEPNAVVTRALDTIFVAPGTTGGTVKFLVSNPDPLAYRSTTFTPNCGTLTSCSAAYGVGLAPQSDSLIGVTFNVPSSPTSQLTKVVLAVSSTLGVTKDSSWVRVGAVPAPSVIVTTSSLNAGASVARDQCLSIAAGDAAGIECGTLRLAHGVPGIRSMGRERAPTLLYSSSTAAPMVLLAANVSVRSSSATDSLKTTLLIGGGATLSRSWPWSPACGTATGCRIVIPVNADSLALATGLYDYTLQVRIGTGPMGQESGKFAVVNDKLSVFGAGWWLEGLERLQVAPDSVNMFWIGGDGSTREYIHRGGDIYTVEDKVSRPDTLLKVGGVWQRRLRNGGHVQFDGAFRHVNTMNRQGHETRFSYSSAGLLDSIVVPTPDSSQLTRAFIFVWDTLASPAKLLTISGIAQSDQGSRVTTLTSDSYRRVTAVTDPDTRQVRYLYAGSSPRVTGRVNRLSDTTDFTFDAFGAVTSVTSRMRADPSIVTTLCAAETRSLVACPGDGTSTSPQFVSRSITRLDGPRSDVLDITRFHIGRFGAPDTIIDALGGRTRLRRANATYPALVTQMTDVAGLVTQTVYNGRGLPTNVTVLSPYGGANAVTTITWDANWDMAVQITSPTGEVAKTGIDSTTGNRLWQQRGTGDSTRVVFGYTTENRLNTVSMASQVLTRYEYDDEGLGNISKTVGARKDTTTIEVNAVGETKVIRTPTTLNGAPTTRTEQWFKRDVMGRVTVDSTRAAAYDWSLAQAGLGLDGTTPLRDAMVVTEYDFEGRPKSVARYSPAQNISESWLGASYAMSRWTYDALGRVGTATSAGMMESHAYDPAGNRISTTTKRGLVVTQTFDPLGRVTSRTTPAVRHNQHHCGDCSISPAYNSNPTRVPYFGTSLAAGKYSPHADIQTETAFFSYDIAGRIVQADNPYALVRRAYYANGALKADTAITRLYNADASSLFPATHRSILSYTYDLSGRRLTRTDNWGGEQTYAYDALGQLDTTTDRASSTETAVAVHFEYDERGQLIGQEIPAAGVATSWGYDVSGLPTRRTESNATGGWYSDSLDYDVRGKRSWMLGRALFTGGAQEEFAAAYDGFGHLIASGFNGGAVPISDKLVVDGHGNAFSRHTNRFGSEEQLVTSIFDGEHLESSAGTPRPEGRGDPGGFGPLVKQIDEMDASFDASGNLIFQKSIRTEWNGLDNNDVFVRSASGSKWSWYLYDADERLRFAQINQLNPGTSNPIPVATQLEYWYDALGRRILVRTRVDSTTCGSMQETGDPYACQQSVARTVWDGDQILKESRYLGGWQYSDAQLDGANGSGAFFGTVRTTQTGAIDVPILVWLNDNDPHVLHRNWRGNVGGATSVETGYANLTMAWPAAFTDVRHAPEYRVDPPTPTGWWGGLIENQKDATGLLYRRNRYYDPATGRFTQEDPIGLAGGMNLYGYASGDPVNNSDPFGLCTKFGVSAAAIDGALPIGDAIFVGICIYRGYRVLNRLIALMANDAEFDEDAGRVHGDIPDEVDTEKGEGELEEEARDYDTSIRNREQEMRRRPDGGDANHRERVRREKEYLQKVEERLKEIQKPEDPGSVQ